MEEMEDKLGAILANPQIMQQIMSMAQALGQDQFQKESQEASPLPNFEPGMIQKASALAKQSHITSEEQALLNALNPYLSNDRILKLKKAMQAAKMAKFASAFLNSGGIQMLMGR